MATNELFIVTETTSDDGQEMIEVITATIDPSPEAHLSQDDGDMTMVEVIAAALDPTLEHEETNAAAPPDHDAMVNLTDDAPAVDLAGDDAPQFLG